MRFIETPEGRDFYRMGDKICAIEFPHACYVSDLLAFMQTLKQYDRLTIKSDYIDTRIIEYAKELKNHKAFDALVKYAPDYDFEFLPALISEWANKHLPRLLKELNDKIEKELKELES